MTYSCLQDLYAMKVTLSLVKIINGDFSRQHRLLGVCPNLPVFENSSAVDDLKLRFSYGVTGRSGFDRYTAQAKYSGFGQYYSDTYGKFIMGYGPGNEPKL